MAWQQPKTNWDTHPKAIEPIDLNRIESNIEVVREQSNMPLLAQIVATLPAAGTPGRLVFCTADNRFYFDNGTQWQVQSAPNLGQVILTPGPENVPIPEGYHNGTGYVVGDANLVAENIAEGINIFGKVGTYTGYTLAPSSEVRISANTTRLLPFGTSGSDKQKLKEIRIGKPGTVRVEISARRVGQGYWYCHVYKNGKAYFPDTGSSRMIGFSGTGSYAYTEYDSGDVEVSAGDLLQVYGCSDVTARLYTFEICYNLAPIPTATEAVLMD